MSRKFFGPLLSFWEPILSQNYFTKLRPKNRHRPNQNLDRQYEQKDAHETFDNYFAELTQNPSNLRKEEKEFFDKHYPEKVGKKFNPYETLQIDEKADFEAVKEAYRKNALKYHPKNDNSEEGQRNFKNLSRAYNEIYRRQTDDYGEDTANKSLFNDFQSEVEKFGEERDMNRERTQQSDKNTEGRSNEQNKNANKDQKKVQNNLNSQQNQEQKQNDSQKNQLKGAQLYSQSSYFEFIDGKRKLHITKMYGKDGKVIKVDRIQDHKADGSVQVSESFDDGKQVRNNKYVTGQKGKKSEQIERH